MVHFPCPCRRLGYPRSVFAVLDLGLVAVVIFPPLIGTLIWRIFLWILISLFRFYGPLFLLAWSDMFSRLYLRFVECNRAVLILYRLWSRSYPFGLIGTVYKFLVGGHGQRLASRNYRQPVWHGLFAASVSGLSCLFGLQLQLLIFWKSGLGFMGEFKKI